MEFKSNEAVIMLNNFKLYQMKKNRSVWKKFRRFLAISYFYFTGSFETWLNHDKGIPLQWMGWGMQGCRDPNWKAWFKSCGASRWMKQTHLIYLFIKSRNCGQTHALECIHEYEWLSYSWMNKRECQQQSVNTQTRGLEVDGWQLTLVRHGSSQEWRWMKVSSFFILLDSTLGIQFILRQR